MKIRWVVAAVGACALAALTLNALIPGWSHDEATHVASGGACPLDAKPANLAFTLKDLQNTDVTLSAYKGKVILLDFWATWCGPCKVEIPGFVELQTQYGEQGLQIIGVSVDDTLEQLQPYAAEMKMNYPVLQGKGHDDMMDAFGPMLGLPTTLLISRDGKICETHAGLTSKEKFEEGIKQLL